MSVAVLEYIAPMLPAASEMTIASMLLVMMAIRKKRRQDVEQKGPKESKQKHTCHSVSFLQSVHPHRSCHISHHFPELSETVMYRLTYLSRSCDGYSISIVSEDVLRVIQTRTGKPTGYFAHPAGYEDLGCKLVETLLWKASS